MTTREIMTVDELLAIKFPDIFLIEYELLSEGGGMMLGGAKGIGKSMIAMQLMSELATGRPAFGSLAVKRPLRGMYVQLEGGWAQVQIRLQIIRAVYPGPTFHIWTPRRTRGRRFKLPEVEKDIVEQCLEREIEVLLIDPMYLMLDGSQIDDRAVTAFVESLDSIRFDTGAAIIIIVHTKKTQWDATGRAIPLGDEAISGHRNIVNWAPVVGMLGKVNEDRLRLDWTERRDTLRDWELKPIEWERNKSGAGLPWLNLASDAGKAAHGTTKVAITLYLSQNGPMFQADLARALPDIPAITLRRALQELLDEGMVTQEKRSGRVLIQLGGQ